MPALEQINNQEIDNQISIAELRDAIKPGWFLSDENNIKEVWKLLNNEELDENDKALLESLTTTIDNEINTIIERWTATEEDIILINVRKELLGENDDRVQVQKLEELIATQNSEANQDITEEAPQTAEWPTEEEIIMQKYDSLVETDILTLSKLNIWANLIWDIDSFLEGWHTNLNFENKDIINALNILNWIINHDNLRHEKLKNIIDRKIKTMSEIVNKRIAGNVNGNADYYKENEKRLIQLRANVCYWENLIINWFTNRWNAWEIRRIDWTNEWITNLYIYKLEFETRIDVTNRMKFKELLHIPNIDKKLEWLSNESKENIMREFLKLFFKIRQPWLFFENKIWDENLEHVFDCFVNAEAFKETPMEEFIYTQKQLYTREYTIKKGEEFNEEEFQKWLKEIEDKLKAFRNPSEYYLAIANWSIEQIITISQGNIEWNHAKYMEEIYWYIQELVQINTLPSNEIDERIVNKKKELYDKIFLSDKYDKLPDDVKRSLMLMINSDFSIQEINNNYPTDINEHIQRTHTEDSSKRNLKIQNGEYLVQLNDNSRHKINNSSYNYIKQIQNGEIQIPWKLTYIITKNIRSYADNTFVICTAVEEWNNINYRKIDTACINNLGTTIYSVPKKELEKFNRYSNINIWWEVNQIIEENNQRYSELEEDIDELCQYNALKNNKKYKISNGVTWEEYAKRWPVDASSNRWGRVWVLHDYNRPFWSPGRTYETRNKFVPEDIHKLKIPWCGEIIIRIEDKEYETIQEKLNSKRCILKNYKAIINNSSWYVSSNGTERDRNHTNEKSQNLLTLNDLAIVEEGENWEIILKDFNWNEIKRIDKETQTEISQIQNESMNILNKPEVEKLQGLRIDNEWNSLTWMQWEISELMKKMDNTSINRWWLLWQIALAQVQTLTPYNLWVDQIQTVDNPFDQNDVDRIRSVAISMKEMWEKVRAQKNDRINLKNMLKDMKNRSKNWISNEMELYIDWLYNSVCAMLDFIKPWWQLDSLANFVLNKQNVYEQTNARQIIRWWLKKNWVVILTAIGFAVAAICAIPTWWATLASMPYLATLLAAAAGTLGWMVWSRVWTVINEWLNNLHRKVIVVDGKQYTIRYDSPTDVEMYLSWQLSWPDFWKWLWKEFAIWTASTFWFMVAWQWIGKWLMQTKWWTKLAEKIRPKAFENVNTQYTDNMFNNIINQGEKEWLLNRFAWEFLEECQEEFVEQGADALWEATWLPILWWLASLYHSLAPSPNINVLQNNHVSFDMWHLWWWIIEWANVNMTVYYESNIDWKTNENVLAELRAYYESWWYTYHPETNTLTKVNENLKMENGEHRINVIHLQPTKVSLDARSIAASQLWQIWWFTVDHETWENFYNPEFKDLLIFKARELWLWQVKIDENWTLTLTTKDNITLEFAPKTAEYFWSQSHRFMVSEVQARMNSNFMDYISETNNLQEIKTRIEEQYKTITWMEIDLTLDQIQAIIDTHNMQWELWNLSQEELAAKRRKLGEVFTDGNVVRFLFEAWFCGKSETSIRIAKANIDYNAAVEALWTDVWDTELEKFKYKTKKEQYQKIKEYCTKTDFMSEHNLYEIFNERISWLETKEEVKEFLVKREATLKFFSGNEVRFRNPETKEIVEWNIFNYGKSLFGDKFETAECQWLRKVMEWLMFNQSLDNPLQYNSHWFDHSILVDAYSQMVIDQNTIGKVCEEYWITPEWAEVLLRLSAVFHDFWYPEIVKVDENWKVLTMDKSMHWLEWWLLFINEIEPAFREFMKLYWAEWTKLDQIVTDMRDAISFHSADKIEKPPYKYKLHTDKWDILINEDINAECAKWIKESYCIDDGEVEIHTQDWAFNENSDAFKKLKQALESQWIKVAEKCKIDEPTNRYTTSIETEAWTVNQYYRWRKWHDAEWWPIWIEIQPIDLYDSPLAGIVRLADNMDMAYNRLSEVQKNPVFMDLMYNLWMDAVWDWTWNPPASKIFQEMEWLKNAAKKVKEWELTPKDREDGKITRGEFETKVREFLSKYWEITTLGVFTYNAEEWTRRRDLSWTMEFNSEWKTDIEKLQTTETSKLEEEAINILNKFKKSLVTELNNLEYPEWWPRWTNQYLEVIEWVSQEEKTWSYSLRHVAWLTCIEDVSIHDWNFVVKLDRNVYYDSSLSSQTVREKWLSIPVNDYHVWRLFDASSKVTIDGQASNIRMVDADGNLMWVITRCSENWKFKPYYTLMDYNWNIVTNAQWKAIFVDEFSTAQTYYQLSMMETSAEFTPKDRQDMMTIINDWKTFAELQEIYKGIKWLKEWDNIDNYKDDSWTLKTEDY